MHSAISYDIKTTHVYAQSKSLLRLCVCRASPESDGNSETGRLAVGPIGPKPNVTAPDGLWLIVARREIKGPPSRPEPDPAITIAYECDCRAVWVRMRLTSKLRGRRSESRESSPVSSEASDPGRSGASERCEAPSEGSNQEVSGSPSGRASPHVVPYSHDCIDVPSGCMVCMCMTRRQAVAEEIE
jgi:hypothetical protein